MPIIITAKKDKFRRCGVAHSAEPQTFEDGHWTAQQLAVLKGERMLMVKEVETQAPEDKSQRPNAAETIKAIMAIDTKEGLDQFYEGEERKSVLEALRKRLSELQG